MKLVINAETGEEASVFDPDGFRRRDVGCQEFFCRYIEIEGWSFVNHSDRFKV